MGLIVDRLLVNEWEIVTPVDAVIPELVLEPWAEEEETPCEWVVVAPELTVEP